MKLLPKYYLIVALKFAKKRCNLVLYTKEISMNLIVTTFNPQPPPQTHLAAILHLLYLASHYQWCSTLKCRKFFFNDLLDNLLHHY